MAWLNSVNCGKDKSIKQSNESVTMGENEYTYKLNPNISHKAPRVSTNSLSVHGSLGIRLNKSSQHLPLNNVMDLKSRHLVCSLHRWANRNVRYKDTVMVCSVCNVSLCLWCYGPFHNILGVSDLRKSVENIIITNNHCPQQHN